MAFLWDGNTGRWNTLNEKTDYPTNLTAESYLEDYDFLDEEYGQVDRPTTQKYFVAYNNETDEWTGGIGLTKSEAKAGGDGTGNKVHEITLTAGQDGIKEWLGSQTDPSENPITGGGESGAKEALRGARSVLGDNETANKADQKQRDDNIAANKSAVDNATIRAGQVNTFNQRANAGNKLINDWSKSVGSQAGTSETGKYLNNKASLENYNTTTLDALAEFKHPIDNTRIYSDDVINNLKGALITDYETYYLTTRINRWNEDGTVGAQPPVGGFDPEFYLENYGTYRQQVWNEAVEAGDLDITATYGNLNNFLHHHYTSIGKEHDFRGNPRKDTEYVDEYEESFKTLTDAEQQYIRQNQLGLVNTETGLGVDWTDTTGSALEAKIGESILQQELEQQQIFGGVVRDSLRNTIDKLNEQTDREKELDVYRGLPGFSEVFGINSSLTNSLIGDSGLGGYLSMAGVNTNKLTDSLERQFSGLTGVNLNSATYNWQKWFDEELSKNIKDLDQVEIAFNVNAELEAKSKQYLLNELLKKKNPDGSDYLTQGNESRWIAELDAIGYDPYQVSTRDQLETLLEGWDGSEYALDPTNQPAWRVGLQKYGLDPDQITTREQLKKYIDDNTEDGTLLVEYEVTQDFKDGFIDEYITPRFDQSKSMDEFISYLDTIDQESQQNVLQTQTTVNALQTKASLEAKEFYDSFANLDAVGFNSEFYIDPLAGSGGIDKVNPEKAKRYQDQKDDIDNEYYRANQNGNLKPQLSGDAPNDYTWNQLAYMYALDLDDINDFAKLHYQVKGKSLNFDPARDMVVKGDIDDFLVNDLAPKLESYQEEIGNNPFLQFVTPEEFADSMLEGINPLENKSEWKELLDSVGLDETAAIEEVREYLIEAFQTGAAKQIREGIKYYNEQSIKPTQEKLGVTYIERDEDYKNIDPDSEDALYNIFKNAGYEGNVDEFYETFMPDADRSDVEFLGNYMSGDLELMEISSDPFEALSQVGGFLGGSEGADNVFSFNQDDDQKEAERSYFTLFDEDDAAYSGSEGGEDYINEYMGLFK